jgi:hypothetical protein
MEERIRTILKNLSITRVALVLSALAVANIVALQFGLNKAWHRPAELPYHEDVARALKEISPNEEIPIAGDLRKQRDLLQERLDKWRTTAWRPREGTQRDQALAKIRSQARDLAVTLDRAKDELARSEVEKRQNQTNSALAQVRELEETLKQEQSLRRAAEDGLSRHASDRESIDPLEAVDKQRKPDVADVLKQAEPHAESTVVDAVADHLWNMTGVYKCYLVQELPLLTASVENPDNLAQLLRTQEESFSNSHRHVKNLTIKHTDAVIQAIQFQAGSGLPSSLHTELCNIMDSALDLEPSEGLERVRKLAQAKAKANQ